MIVIIEKRVDGIWEQAGMEDGVDKALWAARMMSDTTDVDTRVIIELKHYYGEYRKEDAEMQGEVE